MRLTLRPYITLLLLFCLVRTLLPQAWVLALHPHEHTNEARASTKHRPVQGRILLTAKHTHCQTEQFYNVPFQAAPPVAIPLPRLMRRYQPLAMPTTLACSAAMLRRTSLRGPPTGSARC